MFINPVLSETHGTHPLSALIQVLLITGGKSMKHLGWETLAKYFLTTKTKITLVWHNLKLFWPSDWPTVFLNLYCSNRSFVGHECFWKKIKNASRNKRVTAFHPIIGWVGCDAMTGSWWFNPDSWCSYALKPDQIYKRKKGSAAVHKSMQKSNHSQTLY